MRIAPYGERALLAEPDDPHDVPSLRALAADQDGVVDAVAGARAVLAVFDPARLTAERLHALLASADLAASRPDVADRTVELAVRYDGADLAAVAEAARLSPAEVVEKHASADYRVRFCGFSPGFAYLDGLDARLHVARHRTPRTSVPAGSVAIAGEFAGIYPRSSPGGWQLLGTTDAALWDVSRDPPALLTPGTRVRFVPA
jgi:KipI family sensor histidine kinase inhibitor